MLSGLSGRLLDMSARFPQLNYLIQKIAMRKRRDTGIIENFRRSFRTKFYSANFQIFQL